MPIEAEKNTQAVQRKLSVASFRRFEQFRAVSQSTLQKHQRYQSALHREWWMKARNIAAIQSDSISDNNYYEQLISLGWSTNKSDLYENAQTTNSLKSE